MEMEECDKIDLELEDNSLIDENQFSENLVDFSSHELRGALISEKKVEFSPGLNSNSIDRLPELHESMEPERNERNGRYNLRKSLAWDSAFFTNAGVLDAEELSTMITGADKSEKKMLPGIQEEISGSTESISSLGSDTLTMETLEDDLFVDIRASIQRSSKKASALRSSNSRKAAMEVDSAAISTLKKEDSVSQNKNPKPGLKKISSQQTVRVPKCEPRQNIGKLGPGKAMKPDSVPSQTSTAKIGEKNLKIPKPPKTISSSIASSTTAGKREYVGTSRAKFEATVSAKGTQPPKVSSLSGARKALPKPALSSKGSLLASSTTSTVDSTRSSTSSDSSSNMSSRINPGKSTLMTARRSTGKSGDLITGPTGSIPKTPSRITLKNKTLSSSVLSSNLMSAKISSSVSPASSISEWSSASSSSSSMINYKSSNSRTSLETSSCRSMEGDMNPSNPSNHSSDRTAEGYGNQGVKLASNNPKNFSAQTGGNLHAPGKPSGLRMPSNKFGFFDGSSARTPNGKQQSPSAIHNGLPKNGAATGIPVRSSNSKAKSAKVPTSRIVVTSLAIGMKANSPKTKSPASVQEKSMDKRDSPNFSHGVKKISATEEISQELEKVHQAQDGVNQVVANTVATIEEKLGDLRINTKPFEGINASDDVVVNKDHVKKDFDPVCEATDQENCQDNKSSYHDVNGSINGLVSDTSESASCRAPLALKKSLCDNDECTDVPKELVNQVVDKTGFILPSFEQTENC